MRGKGEGPRTKDKEELPRGWVWTTVGAIITPSTEKSDPRNVQRVPYIGLEHIEKDTGRLNGSGHSDKVRSTKARFHSGDLLYGKLRPYLNKVHLAEFDGVCSTDILVFPPSPSASNKFLLYRLLNRDFVRYANQNVSGVHHPRVNYQVLSRFPIALPPLPEQHRIVARIEEFFTQLDAGVEALLKVQAQLKRYRQAVLNAAVRGELTREWREEHRGEIEPASVRLERIRGERRARGLKDVPNVDASGLPELPEGWGWARLAALGEALGGFTKNPNRSGYFQRLPYIGVANVYANELRLNNIQTIGVERQELARLLLQKGDLLVVEGNGSPDQIGRVALWDGSLSPCVHQNHIIKVRFDPIEIGKYALYWLLSSEGRAQITQVASSTSGLYTLSLSKVSTLLIPLAPLTEQPLIVNEIERRLSIADRLETALAQSLSRASSLRQSILQRAFAGKLVPQDPGDEPAEVLLERVRETKKEKEAAQLRLL